MNLFRRSMKRAQRAYLRYAITEERPDLADLPFVQQLRRYALDAIDAHVRSNTPTDPPRLVQQALAYESEDGSRSFWVMHYHIANARIEMMHEDYDELKEEHESELAVMKSEHDEALALLKQTIDMLTQIKNPHNKLN